MSETQTGGVSDDPGRIIYEHEERLKAANSEINRLRIELQETYAGWSDSNSALAEQTAEINKLQTEWQSEFTASQQLRSENEGLQTEIERLRGELQQSEARNTADAETAEYAARLEGLLDNSREALRELQEDHTEMDHRAEGARSAYLAVIKALWEMRR